MKNSKKGISLIVLVITIIVIIILAAAVILTLNNNNPIKEANDARYASDVANMQAVLTNTVSKIMAANQSTITIKKTTIPDTKLDTEIEYTLDYPTDKDNATGTITFAKGTNKIPTETVTDAEGNVTTKAGVLTAWVTGKALPDYTSGTEEWVVDEEGTLTLTVGVDTDNEATYPVSGTVVDTTTGTETTNP